MRSILRAVVLAAAVLAPATSAVRAAETYDVDKSHSSILFRVKHLGVSYAYGRFNDFSGTVVVDADAAKCSVEIVAKTESVDSNDAKRDQHLKSPDFFNVKQFPALSFKSTKVAISGEKYEVTGDLTMKGVTKPLTVVLDRVGSGKDPWGGYRTGFEGTFTVKRSDFGMNYMPDGIGDEVKILISIEGIRK